jgi:predicted kinase
MKKLILIRGPICSGKSTLARLLIKKIPNCSLIDEDILKVAIEPNKTPKWRSNLAFETSLFLTEKLIQKKRTIMAEFHSSKKDRYIGYKKLAERYNYKIYSFLIYPPLDTCIERSKLRIIPDVTYKISSQDIKKYWEKLYKVENEVVFDNPELSPTSIRDQILKLIK